MPYVRCSEEDGIGSSVFEEGEGTGCADGESNTDWYREIKYAHLFC
jgi:hypothetical protein